MKAITLYDPWASLIELGQKEYETRDWSTKYRGPIAIHAAKSKKPWHLDFIWDQPFHTALAARQEGRGILLHPGCILAIATLTDCLEVVSLTREGDKAVSATLENGQKVEGNELAFGDYTPGRYAWKLENVYPLVEPLPARGRQRMWNWDETPHLIAIDPWVIGKDCIWTPKGALTGTRAEPNKEDAIIGLEVQS